MNVTVSRLPAYLLVAAAACVAQNKAAAHTSQGNGCLSCHSSSGAGQFSVSPNPLSVQVSHDGLLTFQITSLGSSSQTALSVQGLETAALNASVGPAGGTWTHVTGPKGTSWISNYIFGTGSYTMDVAIGAAGTVGTYPITVMYCGDGPVGKSSSFNLAITPAGVPGDYNGNGVVDAADYVLWRNGGPLQNEVDAVGTVNAADYAAWRARFGNTAGSGVSYSITAVPEPSSVLLILFGVMGALINLRRR